VSPQPSGSFSNFNGQVLLIHGERDPETETAVARLTALLHTHRVDHQCMLIKGANHSFYSVVWEQELYGLIEHWLSGKYPLPGFPLPTLASLPDVHTTGSDSDRASDTTASPSVAMGGA
jgi:hypothetical protein